jgi:hypothetical protein
MSDVFLSQIISSPKLVKVVWVDAHSQGGPEWVASEDAFEYAHSDLPVINQVGFVLYENEKLLAITDTVGDDVTGTVHSIPKVMIISRSELTD